MRFMLCNPTKLLCRQLQNVFLHQNTPFSLITCTNIPRNVPKCNANHHRTQFQSQHKECYQINETKHKISDLPLHQQTICALASGSGACGVAVIRISGSNSLKLCSLMIPMFKNKTPKPRYAAYSKIFHPINKGLIDTGLVLWFPGPNSFTGEDVIEFQVHGSPAIIKCLLNSIVETDLCRIAQAGEFTRRAFYNNKMDLSEVEGLRDLLNAETDVQRKQALNISRGNQSRKLDEWIGRISDCTSLIDAHIEFGDTDHVLLEMSSINSSLKDIQNEIKHAINTSTKGITIKSGINIALYGVTNVGKSSLLNALTAEDRAIVSDMPNTTRDLIPVRMDLHGYAVNLIDTAGFYNDPSHRIETDAMKKSIEILFDNNTAIHVLVIAADIFINYRKSNETFSVANSLRAYIEGMCVSGLLEDNDNFDNIRNMFVKNTIVVVTKMDIVSHEDLKYLNELIALPEVISTSIVNNRGMDKLIESFINEIKVIYTDFSPEEVQFSSIRTLEAVKKASSFIDNSLELNISIDTKSQFMRAAIGHLSSIFGRSCSADMLDDIFENFCIGK